MTQLVTHQIFYQQTQALANELTNIQNRVTAKEQQLLSGINQLLKAIRQTAKTRQPENIRQLLASYFEQVQTVLEDWQHQVNTYDAGLSFREQFGDSLLVFVYGKVKAGKSSLGNFIATGRGQPDAQWMQQVAQQLHRPEFFSSEKNHDFVEDIDYQQGFKVGETETTSCIQGFKVPGMTWIDSPGLHSVNSANGALAEKYVASADLIIYPMNSAQPGRQSDLAELSELLKKGKRILVLITRCDEVDNDVDDQGELIESLVMKSEKNRTEQAQYVQQALDNLCTEIGITDADTSVLTVSVGYAENQANSPEAMRESGMQALFDKLQSILHSEGIALKKQVPEKNLQAFYQQLLDSQSNLSTAQLTTPLTAAQQQLDQQQQQLHTLVERAISKIQYEYAQQVERVVDEYAEQRDMQAIMQALEQVLTQLIDTHYQQPLQQLYQQMVVVLQQATRDMGLAFDLEFADKTAQIEVDVSMTKRAVSAGAGSLLGGLVGGLLGGPLGAAIGAGLGGVAGDTGVRVMTTKELRTIPVGDNRELVKEKLIEQGQQMLEQSLQQHQRETQQALIQPIQTALAQVLAQINKFEQYLIKEQKHV